jgi:hypothetical protein
MDKRSHHMTDPSPNRLDRKQARAVDRHPDPTHVEKSPEAAAPMTERRSDDPKATKR